MTATSPDTIPSPSLPPGAGPAGASPAARLARAITLLLATVAIVTAGLILLRWGGEGAEEPLASAPIEIPQDPAELEAQVAGLEKEVRKLATSNQKLSQRIRAVAPRGTYLVIDTGANRLYLMKDESVLRDALVSTGSGVRLSDPEKPRSWVFDTPRGEFSIIRKVHEPVWTKPDWAFVEAGEDLPRDYGDRIEEGVLGDYALDLGDGYLIHGTLFERALGLHVTHGCVRMGAKDLEAVFKTVKIGTKVYII